ncbi:MAG: hypothetical protein ACREHE_05630 [Rhizomicrobium sp.]
MSTYTVSTYDYSNTVGVAGYTLSVDHASLHVSGAGSIVTNATDSPGVAVNGAYDQVFADGTVHSEQNNGVITYATHSSLTIHGTVEGQQNGIAVASAASYASILVGYGAEVTGDATFGIDLAAAYANVTVNGAVSSTSSNLSVIASGDYDKVLVGASGVLTGGIGIYGHGDTANIAGTVNGAGTYGAVIDDGSYGVVTVSGHATGYSGVEVGGGYNTAHINGTAEGNAVYGAGLFMSGVHNSAVIGAHGSAEGAGMGVLITEAFSDLVTNNGQVSGYGVYFEQAYSSAFINHGTVTGDMQVHDSIGITIDNTGTIEADDFGIGAYFSTLTVDNSGTIHGDLYILGAAISPVYVPATTVHNSGSWTMTEMYVYGQDFTLINSGGIYFAPGYYGGLDPNFGLYASTGVGLITIDNQAGGTIGGAAGSHINIANGNVDNAGTINLPVNFSGTFINEATGIVNGHVDIVYGVAINYGAIHGSVLGEGALGSVTFVNYGTVDRVVFDTQGTLYNYGTITGHVTGGSGNDTLVSKGSSAVWFNGMGGNDKEGGGFGADTMFGGSGNDILRGNGGADTIDGGSGSDSITGGAGNDILTGGAGADKFVFAAAFGNDVITDFTAGNGANHDLIHFVPGAFADFASVEAAMTVNGDGNVVITLDASDTITLTGVHNTTDLVAQDFGFG